MASSLRSKDEGVGDGLEGDVDLEGRERANGKEERCLVSFKFS